MGVWENVQRPTPSIKHPPSLHTPHSTLLTLHVSRSGSPFSLQGLEPALCHSEIGLCYLQTDGLAV